MAIVERGPSTLEELEEIPGIGEAKIEAYGSAVIGIVNAT
jgi:hypothetical protein